ncbi:MAG: sulfotransferase [Phycisphaerales bacterium]|nr:sulfotransferase [Phycisphaerales bacterium]
MNPQQSADTPKDFFEQAKKLLAVGDVFEASKRAGKLRSYFPEEPPILAIHGFALAKLGIHNQALNDMRASSALTLKALEEGDEENPARPRIVDQYLHLQSEIGRTLIALGEYEDAREEIQSGLDMDPDRTDVVCAMAELESAMGNTEKAIEIIEDAVDRKLDEVDLHISLALVLEQAESFDKERAESCAQQLAKHSDSVGILAGQLMDVLRAHGRLCDLLGQYDEAYNSFRRAAKLRRGGFDPKAHAVITSKLIQGWSAEGIDSLTRPEGEHGKSRVLFGGTLKSGIPEAAQLLERLPNTVNIGPMESLGMLCTTTLKAAKGVLRAVVPTPEGHRGDQLKKLGGGYSKHCDQVARMQGMITLDTHPLNNNLMGCVAMALRGVCIINCRRDPIEQSLAIFCDPMHGNHPYAGDLLATASYVKDCERMMDHWIKILNDERVGARVIDVQYNQLLQDPGAVLRQVGETLEIEVTDDMVADLEPMQPSGPGSHPSEYASAYKVLSEFFAE